MIRHKWIERGVLVTVAITVGAYYLWGVRAAGHPFQWGAELGGYYDYLGQAFAKGHLNLPIQPAPELLALPNPWDPAADDSHKLWDAVLYNRRYYLYHGAGPAVMLFAPWQILTGHDLPENFALFLFCFIGFVFSCGALTRILFLADVRAGPVMLAWMFLALGLCQSVPFLLNRVWVYEIAIGGGYFCFAAGFYFLVRSMGASRASWWLAASGLMFGMAVASRPNLLLAVAVVLAGLAISSGWRVCAAFLVPLATVGVLIAVYNYERFGNPLEFGLRYLLSGPFQNRLHLAAANMATGIYYLLFSPPDFSAVFPWVRMVLRPPFGLPGHPLPPEYFAEPIVGGLFLAPFAMAAFLVPGMRGKSELRIVLWTLPIAVLALLLFQVATGFSTPRYEVDILPWAALAALGNIAIFSSRCSRIPRSIINTVLISAIGFGAFVNLALAISGPFDEMLKNRPERYMRLARRFSPVERLRPLLNPPLEIGLSVRLHHHVDGFREPLLTIGRAPWRHFVYAEHLDNRVRIVSRSGDSTLVYEMAHPGQSPFAVRVLYAPETHTLTTSIDGKDVLAHKIGTLLAAPSQIEIGRNSLDPSVTAAEFTGEITQLEKTENSPSGLHQPL
jgi:hypothetical protein